MADPTHADLWRRAVTGDEPPERMIAMMDKPSIAERYRRWRNADGPGPVADDGGAQGLVSAAPMAANANPNWTAADFKFEASLKRRLGGKYRGFTGKGYANRYGGGFVYRPAGQKPTTYVLHHTAGAAGATGASIWNYHVNSRGWDTDGYHLLVSPDGSAELLIPPSMMSYGAGAVNPTTIHICLHGNYTVITPDPRALATIYQVFLALDECYGNYRWRGHKEVGQTACPGALQGHLVKMRGAAYGAASPPKQSYP